MTQATTAGVMLAMAVLLGTPHRVAAQQPATAQPSSIDETITAAEAEVEPRTTSPWNEWGGSLGSIRVGGGFLWDYATYSQDANSKEQIDMAADGKLRDLRVLLSGRLGFRRRTTWSMGFMYDANKDEWVVRQTGIMVAVPEIWGDIFVGRSKEGFSLNKVMIGYGGWTMERAPMNEATIPILADGVKWLGYVPKARILWNLGFFGDAASEGQTFSSYENQLAGRFAWLPIFSEDGGTLLHVGGGLRLGKVNSGTLRLRARPGAWPAPYFLDTEEFAADSTTMTGLEAYYRPGRFTFGTEYFFQNVDAPESGDPFFHGGEAFFSWMITGETRSYNTRGGYFNQISPLRSVYSGGPGAWEIVTNINYTDLDSGTVSGGKFWRFTPMLNWYLSDHIRFELAYGYSSLDRFGVVGHTQFLQTRLQLQL